MAIEPTLRARAKTESLSLLREAGIQITVDEVENLEIADFGLGDLEVMGLQIITYINTSRYCAKELIMLPNQICPEHRHPMVQGEEGKQETFRCRYGTVYLYSEGEPTPNPQGRVPKAKSEYFTVWQETILQPGEQYTLAPNTKHWFQAGPQGAIVSEFSSTSRDEADIFTDPAIRRVP